MTREPNGETVDNEAEASPVEKGLAYEIVSNIEEFFETLADDRGAPAAEFCERGDLNNVAQAKAFFQMVAKGRLR